MGKYEMGLNWKMQMRATMYVSEYSKIEDMFKPQNKD